MRALPLILIIVIYILFCRCTPQAITSLPAVEPGNVVQLDTIQNKTPYGPPSKLTREQRWINAGEWTEQGRVKND